MKFLIHRLRSVDVRIVGCVDASSILAISTEANGEDFFPVLHF